MVRYQGPGSPRGTDTRSETVRVKRWYATEPMGMAGTGAPVGRLVPTASPCGAAVFGTGVKVRTQHATNPSIGRPLGLRGAPPG
jgi:hypothetical protein